MKRLLRATAMVTAGLASIAAGTAQTLPICNVDTGRVDPMLLMRYFLKDIPFGVLDRNVDGAVGRDELVDALVDPQFCGPLRGADCTAARRSLMTSRDAFQVFLSANTAFIDDYQRNDDDQVSARDVRALLGLDAERRYVMRCPFTIAEAPAPTSTGSDRNSREPAVRFRLGRAIDDLSRPRGTDAQWEKVQTAEFSFTDDNQAGTQTLAVHATAGIEISWANEFMLLPFVQFIRSDVDSDNGTGDSDTAKLSFGLTASIPQGRYGTIALSPLYTFDLEADSEIIGGQIIWRPSFFHGLPGYGVSLGVGPVETVGDAALHLFTLRTDLYPIVSFGEVLAAGTNPALTDGREFLRAGGFGQLVLTGMRGPFKNFALDLSYRRLFRLLGDDRDISEFRSSLRYWLEGGRNASVQLSYTVGIDQETLKEFDKWSLGLGLRF